MFRGDLIIDGYNVLHAADCASSLGRPGGLEQARESLLRLISEKLATREKLRTTVVFDAPAHILGPSPPRKVHQLLVMFADREGDADAAIERLIRQNTAPRRLCVISSDHRLQKAARRRRAKFLDSDVFLRQLARRSRRRERRGAPDEPAAKHSGELPPGEVEAWLRVFEDMDDIRSPNVPATPPANGTRKSRSAAETSHAQQALDVRQHSSGRSNARRTKQSQREARIDAPDEIEFWESRIAELDDELD